MTTVRTKTRAWAPGLLVCVVLLLSVGTIRNQLAINSANSKLALQAQNGQKALVRSCRLAGVSRKIYADELQRHVITTADFALFASTLARACSSAKP